MPRLTMRLTLTPGLRMRRFPLRWYCWQCTYMKHIAWLSESVRLRLLFTLLRKRRTESGLVGLVAAAVRTHSVRGFLLHGRADDELELAL